MARSYGEFTCPHVGKKELYDQRLPEMGHFSGDSVMLDGVHRFLPGGEFSRKFLSTLFSV